MRTPSSRAAVSPSSYSRSRENVRLATNSSDEELFALSVFDLAVAAGFVGNLDECERALDEFFRGAPVRNDLAGWSTSALAHAWRGSVLQNRDA